MLRQNFQYWPSFPKKSVIHRLELKVFSYSLARTDGALALDAIPAALMLHQSAVEALRECEDAMTGD
jgi:hypothetical protein